MTKRLRLGRKVMHKEDLETRLSLFLESFDGSVSLDHSFENAHLLTSKKADYLFDNAKIVVEVKTLNVDPVPKVKAFLEKYSEHPDFPEFYWPANPEDYLSPLPNSSKLKSELRSKVNRRVQSYVKDADDQIRDTKHALKLPDACGVLIILNDKVPYLGPDLIFEGASKVLMKLEGGQHRYRNIQLVQIISETHHLNIGHNMIGFPVVTLIGPTANNSEAQQSYLSMVQAKFSESMNVPYFDGGDALVALKQLHLTKFSPHQSKTQEMANHERWRANYGRYPYLRSIPDDRLLSYGASLAKSFAPHITKGNRPPISQGKEILVKFTHFLEECQFRKMDMQKLQTWMSKP